MDGGRGRGPEGWVLLLSEGGGRVQRQKCEREGEAAAFIMPSAQRQRHRNTSLVCDYRIFHSSHLGPFPWRISFRMAFGVFFRLSVSRFTDPRERKAAHRYPRRFFFRGGKFTPWGRVHCHRGIDIRDVMKWVYQGLNDGYEARRTAQRIRGPHI